LFIGLLSSGAPGTGSSDPCLPTGDGEAMSHSAPLEHPSLFVCPGGPGIVIQGPSPAAANDPISAALRLCHSDLRPYVRPDGPGDGEHLSLPLPVGGPHCVTEVAPNYFRYTFFHHGFPGAGRAVCARASSWCSSAICVVWASMTCPWDSMWASRAAISFPSLSVVLVPGSGKNTRQVLPAFSPSSSPAFRRRRIVSVLTFRCSAAWAMLRWLLCMVRTHFLCELGNMLGNCLGRCLGMIGQVVGRLRLFAALVERW